MRTALALLALGACHVAPPPQLASNIAHDPPAAQPAPISRELRNIPRPLHPDLALVRSFAHQHDMVSLEGLEAGERVFTQIRWKGMSPGRVAALLGEPTAREQAAWRYDLEYAESNLHSRSVFLILRFENDLVDRIVHGEGELRIAPTTH